MDVGFMEKGSLKGGQGCMSLADQCDIGIATR
jgi:hypothetical protein